MNLDWFDSIEQNRSAMNNYFASTSFVVTWFVMTNSKSCCVVNDRDWIFSFVLFHHYRRLPTCQYAPCFFLISSS